LQQCWTDSRIFVVAVVVVIVIAVAGTWLEPHLVKRTVALTTLTTEDDEKTKTNNSKSRLMPTAKSAFLSPFVSYVPVASTHGKGRSFDPPYALTFLRVMVNVGVFKLSAVRDAWMQWHHATFTCNAKCVGCLSSVKSSDVTSSHGVGCSIVV
jgi:hypothetical protein